LRAGLRLAYQTRVPFSNRYRLLGAKMQDRVLRKVKAVVLAAETNPDTRGSKHPRHDRRGQIRTKVGNIVVIFYL